VDMIQNNNYKVKITIGNRMFEAEGLKTLEGGPTASVRSMGNHITAA